MSTDSAPPELSRFRSSIDEIDRQILDLFRQRFDVCILVADFKKEHGLPMMQPERVAQVAATRAATAAALGLNVSFVEVLYRIVIDEACRIEDERMAQAAEAAARSAC